MITNIREYYTVKEAAILLECHTDELIHLYEINAIELCYKFDLHSKIDASSIILHTSNEGAEKFINKKSNYFNHQWQYGEINVVLSNEDLLLTNDEFCESPNKNESIEIIASSSSCFVSGFFTLYDMTLETSSKDTRVSDKENVSIVFEKYDASHDEVFFSFTSEIQDIQTALDPSKCYIMKKGFTKLVKAINSGLSLPNIYNAKPKTLEILQIPKEALKEKNQHRESRFEDKQISLIFALINAIPALKAKIEASTSLSNVPIIINNYLHSKKLPLVEPITDRTLRNWIKKSRYPKKITLKNRAKK